MTSFWLVKNRDTGIVVSQWRTQDEAWTDKDKRDSEWAAVESPERSKLIVERFFEVEA